MKKKQQKSKEFDFSTLSYPELKELHKKLTNYISKFKKELVIYPSLFKVNLAPLETLVKFLIENNRSIKEVSILLNRSPKTIWQAYNSAKRKHPKSFVIKEEFPIPISIFSNRKLSILESLVSYLKDTQNLKFSQIAVLLNRDQRTIWTSYSRARKKNVK